MLQGLTKEAIKELSDRVQGYENVVRRAHGSAPLNEEQIRLLEDVVKATEMLGHALRTGVFNR